jgi:hypothetical protein
MCGCNSTRSWPRSDVGASPPPRQAPADSVAVRYLGTVSLLVRGAVSGRVYALRPEDGRINCDPRDLPAFLASPLFERLE